MVAKILILVSSPEWLGEKASKATRRYIWTIKMSQSG